MDLRLQFGYGMMEHCRALLTRWGGGDVILSPRDLTKEQMLRFAKTVAKVPNMKLSVDPQFYLPHSDHYRLCAHDFWPKEYETGLFWQGQGLTKLLIELEKLNIAIGCREFILPGLLAARVDDEWLEAQGSIADEAETIGLDNKLATIALSADAVRDSQQIGTILEAAENWPCSGFYLVCEHPKGQYLVDDANWLTNVLDLAAGLKLLNKKVVLGYCNQQLLVAALSKADTICSGTWMNVRSFPPEKFKAPYDDEMKQRSTWYYCPQTLSEYKIPFLDIAFRQGVLEQMKPPRELDGGYVTPLFAGTLPSNVDFSEQAAFRHYLHSLKKQTELWASGSYEEAIRYATTNLESAGQLARSLNNLGVRGQLRDFSEIVDVNLGAVALFESVRGPMMRRKWTSL